MKIQPAVMFLVTTVLGSLSVADRLEVNTLSQCIEKADVIVLGTVCEEIEGTNSFNTLILERGFTFERTTETILTNDYFKVRFPACAGVVSPSCIPVESGERYFFFLSSKKDDTGRFRMFHSVDGIVQYNEPVLAEIFEQTKKLKRQNPKSGKGECLAPPPHTTGHAGPHPAVPADGSN